MDTQEIESDNESLCPSPSEPAPATTDCAPPVPGRRIVHIQCLAKDLEACVNPKCGNRLSLMDIQEERQYGLASVFFSFFD